MPQASRTAGVMGALVLEAAFKYVAASAIDQLRRKLGPLVKLPGWSVR